VGIRPDCPGRSLSAPRVARPDQHGEPVADHVLGDLKTDSLISPGDQGDGFVLHGRLQLCIAVWPTSSSCVIVRNRNDRPLYTERCSV
jgi:hypothetical protein